MSFSPSRLIACAALLPALTLLVAGSAAGEAHTNLVSMASTPPRTPGGLPACTEPLALGTGLQVRRGELIEYDLEIMGMDVGTLSFTIAREGTYEGAPVIELKSDLKVDRMVAKLVPLEGSAAALVTPAGTALQAAQRYRWATLAASEVQTYSSGGRVVASKRLANDERSDKQRGFHAPVRDFLSAFYVLRQLPRDARGCSIVYSGQKAYTVWLEPDGEERISTVQGLRLADRYKLRYGSDQANLVREARVWVSQDERRVPYKAEGQNTYRPRAALLRYSADGKR